MPEEEKVAETLTRTARELEDETDPQAAMDAAVHLTRANIHGCDAAAITFARRGEPLDTVAYTDVVALAGDELQYALGEGPCIDAIWQDRVIRSHDLEREARWPAWAPRVAREHGIRSMLCVHLFTHATTLGALNLYARQPDAFTDEDRDVALALAAQIAVAIAAAQRATQLTEALASRTVIGQACGMLMERYGLAGHQAFGVLARLSSETNVKVRDIALELVTTGRLPGAGEPPRP